MRSLFIIFFSFCTLGISAQFDTISLRNPSFEDNPRMGSYYNRGVAMAQQNNITGWYDCGILNFPTETAP